MTRAHLTQRGALALGAVLLLGSCSWFGGDDAAPSSSGPVEGADDGLPATAWSRAEPDAVVDGGTLRLAVGALPKTFNPVHADGIAAPETIKVLAPTTGSAVRIVADGGWRVDPDYARSVDVIDRSPLTVRVRLNRDAVWQDGTPITAKDMTAFRRAMSGRVAGLEVASTDGYDDITVKKGSNRFEYTVTFGTPRADWPRFVYPRLPAEVSTRKKAFNQGFRSRAVPSNGPFVVASIDTTTGTITEKRNPRWWGRAPRLDRVVWRIAEPDVQAKAFAGGELDAVDVDPSTYESAKEAGSVQRAGGRAWSHLTLNGGRGPLKDVRVRRAVAAALDRSSLAESVAEPVGAPGRTAGSLLLVPGQQGYRDVAATSIKGGADRARALLTKAGYPQKDGKATRKGKPLTLTLPVPSGTPSSADRARAIADDLKAVGITVKTPTVKSSSFFASTVVPLDFDLVTFTWPASPFPVELAEPRFRPVDSPQNFTGLAARKARPLWDKASRTVNAKKRANAIHELDATLLDQAVVVPLAVLPEVVVVRRGLVNYGAATFEEADFTRVGFTTKK